MAYFSAPIDKRSPVPSAGGRREHGQDLQLQLAGDCSASPSQASVIPGPKSPTAVSGTKTFPLLLPGRPTGERRQRLRRPSYWMAEGPSRFDALTGIRAFAAAWVVSFHYILGPFGALGGANVSQFVDVGYLGVDLFFILSGFVIWHMHAQEMAEPSPRKFARFMSPRFARLYPVDLFSLLLLAALFWLRPMWGTPRSIRPTTHWATSFFN